MRQKTPTGPKPRIRAHLSTDRHSKKELYGDSFIQGVIAGYESSLQPLSNAKINQKVYKHLLATYYSFFGYSFNLEVCFRGP